MEGGKQTNNHTTPKYTSFDEIPLKNAQWQTIQLRTNLCAPCTQPSTLTDPGLHWSFALSDFFVKVMLKLLYFTFRLLKVTVRNCCAEISKAVERFSDVHARFYRVNAELFHLHCCALLHSHPNAAPTTNTAQNCSLHSVGKGPNPEPGSDVCCAGEPLPERQH